MIRLDVGNELPDEVGDIYARYRGQLIGLATLLSGSRATAEEVVQDVFTAAIPKWNTIQNADYYLRRSVVNRVRSLGRRDSRARALPRPREAVTGEPQLDEAWRLLQRLPPRQRAVLVLRIYLDLPDHEIAHFLDCPEPTVRSLAFRALTTLRKDLS